MRNVLLQAANTLNKKHKQKKWWQRAVRVMGAIVVFCTTYALILPAITMEQEPVCGLEAHEHTESCYTLQVVHTLACDVDAEANVVHAYDALCYDADGELICQLPERLAHTHEDSCFEQMLACDFVHIHSEECITVEEVLVCGEEEREGHTHDESCITVEDVLICEQEECEAHVHGEDCIAEGEEQTCMEEERPGHTHDEDCYELCNVPCEVMEDEGHTHDEACYEVHEIPCELTVNGDHVHDETCYEQGEEPACGLEELGLHTHEQTCCDEEGALVCTIPETVFHVHTEDCLVEQKTEVPVLTCEIPVHIHEADCYPKKEDEEPQHELLCGSGVHAHVEGCYDEEGTLTCTIPAHSHDASCLVADLDLTSDMETQGQWDEMIRYLTLTGSWPEDVLTVARSQLGYTESARNVILEGEKLKGYTRYGAKYNDPYGDWDAMFVSFCLEYAGVKGFPLYSDSAPWVTALEEQGLYTPAAEGMPQPGGLVFFGGESDGVGVVAELIPGEDGTPARMEVIQGDVKGKVAYVTWTLDDPAILGYGILPEPVLLCELEEHIHNEACVDENSELICALAEHTHSDQCLEPPAQPVETLPLSQVKLICPSDEHSHEETCYDPETGDVICGTEEHSHTNDCYDPASATFIYEDDSVLMEVNVVSYQGLPEGMIMNVDVLSPADQAWASYADYALENAQGDLFGLTGYQIRFYLNGQEILLSDADVTVQLTVRPVEYRQPEVQTFSLRSAQASEPASTTSSDSTEPDKTIVVTVLQEGENDIEQSGSAVFSGDSAEGERVTIKLGSSRTLALASETAPEFKVEFYANMPHYVWDHTGSNKNYPASLDIIDTTSDGDGDGGSLPRVGSSSTPRTEKGVLHLYLEEYAPTNKENHNMTTYKVATEYKLTEIYTADDRVYIPGMSVDYLNKLKTNPRYAIERVWVSQNGGATFKSYGLAVEDDDPVDVEINDISKITFTNNPDSASDADGIVLITSNTVIRFEYHVISDFYSNAANFYDYDISTGVVLDSSNKSYSSVNAAKAAGVSTFYMQTNQKGINSSGNYVNSGAKLAFGNANTGMGLDKVTTSSGMYLNQYNSTSRGGVAAFKGCAFGIVTGLTADGTLIYANGIAHQNLFNEGGSMVGKTSYGGQMLNFERIGDTYTLVAVNGGRGDDKIGEQRLNEFFNPHSDYPNIYTNNFWPMDGMVDDDTVGHDMIFGDTASYGTSANTSTRRFTDGNGNWSRLPPSDDYLLHNSYFGLQYAVSFEMDGQYCGPLEYLFYGDDDMWVFLTNEQTGETQLICDIGGVHSSVGSYTNLWDYISKGEAGKGKYTLHFYYLERGASGSSCYMAFTLPGVASVPQNMPDYGTLNVRKESLGESDPNAAYQFRLDLTGTGAGDRYSYIVSGGEERTGTIASGGTFTVRANETVSILNLPSGINYTLTELFAGNGSQAYDVRWTNSDGSTVSGSILPDKVMPGGTTETIVCTNIAVGGLEIEKTVSGVTTDEKFKVDITLADADGNPVSGTFGGTVFTDGKATVEIAHGQKLSLTGIPVGTVWTAAEQLAPGYSVSYLVDGTSVAAATGVIGHNATVQVTVINTAAYKLPQTGGIGTGMYSIGGFALLTAAVALLLLNNRKSCGKEARKRC